MKISLFRHCIAFISSFVVLGATFINAQPLKYKILSNNPKDVQNLTLTVFPISMSGVSAFTLDVGASASYRYKDKALVNTSFLFGIVNDLEGKFDKAFASIDPYTLYYELSPLYNFNIDAHYFPISFIMKRKVHINLKEAYGVVTYTKVPLNRQVLMGLRCGYTVHRNVFKADGMNPDINGTLIGMPGAPLVNILGKFNYSFQALKVGFGVYVKDNFSVQMISDDQSLAGVKKDKGVIYVYVDYLHPLNLTYHGMTRVFPASAYRPEPEIFEYTLNSVGPKSKHGFMFGYSWFSMTEKNTLGSAKLEIGLLPGPVSPTKNLFISLGLGFGIGKYVD